MTIVAFPEQFAAQQSFDVAVASDVIPGVDLSSADNGVLSISRPKDHSGVGDLAAKRTASELSRQANESSLALPPSAMALLRRPSTLSERVYSFLSGHGIY